MCVATKSQHCSSVKSCALSLENYVKGGNIWMMQGVHYTVEPSKAIITAVGRWPYFFSLAKPDLELFAWESEEYYRGITGR